MDPKDNIREGGKEILEGSKKIGEGMGEAVGGVKQSVKSAATGLAAQAKEMEAREGIGRIVENVRSRFEGKSYDDLKEEVSSYVKEYPGRTLLYALGAGFVLGLIFKR